MKHLLTTFLASTCFYFSFAQTKLALKGGFNYSTARAYFNQVKQSTGYVPGGNFTIQLKTVFEGSLHFSPYISYTTRGYIINAANNPNDKTQNFIHYIDMSPVLSIDFVNSMNNRLVIGVGPVASLALAGREKTTISGVTSSNKMRFSTSSDYGLFDMGIHTSIGCHFKKFLIEAAYQYGFASINNNEERDKKNIRNRTFSLNLGYYIKSYK